MKNLFVVLGLLGALAVTSLAHADPSCTERAAEKKLAGAAKNSFMKKCEADSTAACESAAGEKKLAGAAKNSFVKKCVKDSVGATS